MRRPLITLTAVLCLTSAWPAAARDGALDYRFGYASADFGGNDISRGMAVQPDHKVVMSGSTTRGDESDFALARFTSRGTLDPSFSKDGKVTINFGGSDSAWAVAMSPGSKIVVAGFTYGERAPFGDFAIARLNKDGSLDKTFGTNGKAIVDVTGWIDLPTSLVVEPDGKIIAAGLTVADAMQPGALIDRRDQGAGEILRLLPNGVPDPTFGVAGRQIVKVDGGLDMLFAIARQKDGAILVAGESSESDNAPARGWVKRYLTTGTPDPTFGTAGSAIFSFGAASNVASLDIAKSGSILIGGGSAAGLGAMRLRPNGTPDPSFSRDGRAELRLPGPSYARSVVAQSDGSVVVSGSWLRCFGTFCLPYPKIVRFTKAGAIDKRFGAAGSVEVFGMWWTEDLKVDGGSLVAGGWGFGRNGNDFKAMRLSA